MKDSYMKDRLEGIYDEKIRELDKLTTSSQKYLANDYLMLKKIIRENPPEFLRTVYGELEKGHAPHISWIVERLSGSQQIIKELGIHNKTLLSIREEVKAILRDKFDRFYDQYMCNGSGCLRFICNANNITVSALVDYAFEKREEK